MEVAELRPALEQLSADLQHIGVEWALVGGLAISVRAQPRTTRDIDVAVAVADDTGTEQVMRSLFGLGYRLHKHLEHKDTGRIMTIRSICRDPPSAQAGIIVDLLFASSGIEPEVVHGAEEHEVFDGLTIPVASNGHLIAMKLLSFDPKRRIQDLQDAYWLAELATESDIAIATRAVDLITERGFHRGRDLRAALEGLLQSLDS